MAYYRVYRRGSLPVVTAALFFICLFLIYYVTIQNPLEVGRFQCIHKPFIPAMPMNHSKASSSVENDNRRDTVLPNSDGIVGVIDNTVHQIDAAGTKLTEIWVKADLPIIYVVTPTYRRPEQIPDLTRMAQTLLNVPAIHWIVVEDSTSLSPAVSTLLKRYLIPHTHLSAEMPEKYKNLKLHRKPRGVSNRNAALDWVRSNCKSGVVYFADDDNTYDIRLFDEMRYTKKVSMWPVGLVTEVGLSSPVVNKEGIVVDFFDGWIGDRQFPVDMAGFAVSVQLILEKSDVYVPYVPGYEEDGFLKKLNITRADIEPKADQCTKILVWHTQTELNWPAKRATASSSRYKGTNIDTLQELIV